MRKSILGALVALAISGTGAGVLIANAQPAPPPAGQDGAAPPRMSGDWTARAQRWRDARGQRGAGQRPFALIYRQKDRQLSPADVQKIAEGFLLWNGNHAWKVVDVAPGQDGAVGFALATGDGSVIARFTMDPHSGRVTRTG
jgi:hypothetical protein